MFLPGHLYQTLAQVDDSAWQTILERHPFWRSEGVCLDAEHDDVAFHILMHQGQLARSAVMPDTSPFSFDAVRIADHVLADAPLVALVEQWSQRHAAHYSAGVTVKMGLYVIRAGGTLGFHVDGPVFLNGMRADLSDAAIQLGMIEAHASHRTILPLRFNAQDKFMLCAYRAPLRPGELFEFSNMLPHAYFNRGSEHAVLLVTTYLSEALLPREVSYTEQ